jgi:ABC-2 type transport system permease protein
LRSPECARRPNLTLRIFAREVRQLFIGRALWAMLIIVSPLVGFSFVASVALFGEASRSVARFPELARSMIPLNGIVAPTFSGLYLMNTFLLPFVAIRLVGEEKQSGSLKLLQQLPLGSARLVAIKAAALAVGWLLATLPALSAMLIWVALGGHLSGPELAAVLLGHGLYAAMIASVALLAAALTDTTASAAIVALAFTLGCWVVEFAGGTQGGWLRDIAAYSPAAALRSLERGLFDSARALTLVIASVALLLATAVWLPLGVTRLAKVKAIAMIAGGVALALFLAVRFPFYFDLSEDRRNSFNPADERALQQLQDELRITLYLAPGDSRLQDLERNVLGKLRRTVPRLSVTLVETGKVGVFGAATSDKYGLGVYEYAGKREESRATAADEILTIIHGLAGQTVSPDPVAEYSGYPLSTDASGAGIWFYGLLPALWIACWWLNQRTPGASVRALGSGAGRAEPLPSAVPDEAGA